MGQGGGRQTRKNKWVLGQCIVPEEIKFGEKKMQA